VALTRAIVGLLNLLVDGDVGEGGPAVGENDERSPVGEVGIVRDICGVRGDLEAWKLGGPTTVWKEDSFVCD